ncbi:MAG: hypothetical protein PHQ19_07810 [Candidatus Krumholzibacteria bacterium]|nr:hypothetical protein [Candidatus Krumholzibacteria bacterium]
MKVKPVCEHGKLEMYCEECDTVAMSDIVVSDNGQPFLEVTCRLCGEKEQIELCSDAWPHLPSRIAKKK